MSTSTINELFGLKGKVAIITGGAQGIGSAITELLAGAGAFVVIVDVNAELAAQQASKLCDMGLQAASMSIDVSEELSVKEGVAHIVNTWGAPWILVNNAGIQNRKPFFEIDAEFFDLYYKVNARGTFFMMREVGKVMVEADQGGRIVNISSLGVVNPMLFGLVAYQASKGAVSAMTRAVALELIKYNITVNAVLPGGTDTPGGRDATGTVPEGPAMRGFPLDFCEPVDIASAVAYLASPAARRVTGQELIVDSGFLVS